VNDFIASEYRSPHFCIKAQRYNPHAFFGNSIEVKISETVLDEPTVEYLVNFDFLKEYMEAKGFMLIQTTMFDEYYRKWQTRRIKMSELECKIAFLNRSFVFQRLK
ncbi:MAG: hypothetical protein ACMG6E_06440, partial [Candidatus Roizmanbacteria bacterium]